MPTYTYGCKSCGHEFDVFHAISATPRIKCESCASAKVERHLGTGAGIIFKGSGFYETDFKGKKGTKPSEGGGESKGSGESKGTGESKGSSKSEGSTKSSESKASCGTGCGCAAASKN
jgi:putative FmdB family regulatory protein